MGFVPKRWTDNRKKKRGFAGHNLFRKRYALAYLIASLRWEAYVAGIAARDPLG
jgi:hypothetical protein